MRIPAMKCALVVLACLCVVPVFAAPCDSLRSLALPDTTVTMAQVVAAGQFLPPAAGGGGAGNANVYKSLPEFCRVTSTLKPSSDSDIKVEFWMPTHNWNGKLEVVGNGGWAGTISYSALAEAVREGYASASTDTGHVGGNGDFIVGHPEKLIDFSYRSEHEMTVKAKLVVQAFYGSAARISYWNGCSTGGRQGMNEAQRYPNDFDGIVAGAPGKRNGISLWIADAVLKKPESYIPPSKYPMIHKAVLDACDAIDGLKDGLIDDPRKCHFNPSVLLCKGADGPSCLTVPQVAAAKQIYSPAINPRTKQVLFPSFVPGTELGWNIMALGPNPYEIHFETFKNVVFKDDPDWDWRTYDFDADEARADRALAVMNSNDPNLGPFFSHNGKLLIYQGWADANVPTLNNIEYYNLVLKTLGGTAKVGNNIRMFLAPGMGHCGGGDGPNEFDKIGPLDEWVEHGKAPERIVASHSSNGKVDRTRPLCPYPQVEKYTGSGSIDDAANFVCRVL